MVHRKQDSSDLNHILPLIHEHRKPKPSLLRLFLLFSLLSFSFLFASRILFPYEDSLDTPSAQSPTAASPPPCSPLRNNTICCDRTSPRSDICYMTGHIRTHSPSNSLLLLSSLPTLTEEHKIRPYTRKWEPHTMSTIDQLRLIIKASPANDSTAPHCDVHHDVPAIFFSTGGYTGNVYHEFNDGIIPLYLTSHQFNRRVVFVILEYHDWWISKYENILSRLSDFPPIDFSRDNRTHCFPKAIVGLNIHDELTIDPAKTTDNRSSIQDFRRMLDDAYRPRIEYIERVEEQGWPKQQLTSNIITPPPPKLLIVSRNGSRGVENEADLVRVAEGVGFRVEVLRPGRTTELAKIYRAINGSDVMVAVHGAAMTHLLFMRPGSVFIQIVPLGTDWAADTYYGEPARKLGLNYVRYGISAEESSLYREYHKDDPVLRDPESVNAKGWEVTKRVYLDGQKVRLDLERFRKRLVKAHRYVCRRDDKETAQGF